MPHTIAAQAIRVRRDVMRCCDNARAQAMSQFSEPRFTGFAQREKILLTMERYSASPIGSGRRQRRKHRHRGLAGEVSRDRWGRAVAGLVILSGLSAAIAAPAEEPPPGGWLSGLRGMLGPDRAPGMRVGGAIVTPSLDMTGSYDSNVFAARSHGHSDWFAGLLPGLDIDSDWSRHSFSLKAQGEFRQYATFSREDVNNASVAATGRIDLAPNAYVLTAGSYQLLHEDRGALVPVNGISPTPFSVTSGRGGFVIEPAPLGLRLDATIDSYAYDNVRLFGGMIARETARDRIVYALEPRISYQILPQYDGFVRAVVNRRQYNSTREPDGLARSSMGYAADIGTSLKLPGFAAGELYLGYLAQNYDARLAKRIAAVDFGGNVEWHPSAATALRINLARSIEESAMLGSQGYLQTAVRLGVEHEVIQRVILVGSVSYSNADFAGATGTSNLYGLRLGTRLALVGTLSAGLEYDLGIRASSATLPSYTRQVVELRLRGEL
jgi:hypothetical protein